MLFKTYGVILDVMEIRSLKAGLCANRAYFKMKKKKTHTHTDREGTEPVLRAQLQGQAGHMETEVTIRDSDRKAVQRKRHVTCPVSN